MTVGDEPVQGLERLGLPGRLLAGVGGPRGRFAMPLSTPGARLAPLIALAAAPIVLGLLRLSWCLDRGWGGNTPIYRGCYSDLIAGIQTTGVGDGLAAYLTGHAPSDAPPLSAAVHALVAGLAPGEASLGQQRWFVALWAILALACVALLAVLVATTRAHPGANGAMVALSPVVGLTVFMGPEIVPATLVGAGIWAWSRGRSRLAGVLLGLAVLAGPWAALVLVAIWLTSRTEAEAPDQAAADEADRADAELRRLGIGVAAGVGVSALFFLGSPATFVSSYAAWWSAGVGNGSPWYLLTMGEHPLTALVATALAIAGWVGALWLMGRVAGQSGRAIPVGALAFLGVAVVVVTGKAFALQSSLWLVPLVALAGLPWRRVLVYWAVEAAHYLALWLHVSSFSDANHSLPAPWYAMFLLARLGVVAWLVTEVRAAWVLGVPAADDRAPGEGAIGGDPTDGVAAVAE